MLEVEMFLKMRSQMNNAQLDTELAYFRNQLLFLYQKNDLLHKNIHFYNFSLLYQDQRSFFQDYAENIYPEWKQFIEKTLTARIKYVTLQGLSLFILSSIERLDLATQNQLINDLIHQSIAFQLHDKMEKSNQEDIEDHTDDNEDEDDEDYDPKSCESPIEQIRLALREMNLNHPDLIETLLEFEETPLFAIDKKDLYLRQYFGSMDGKRR